MRLNVNLIALFWFLLREVLSIEFLIGTKETQRKKERKKEEKGLMYTNKEGLVHIVYVNLIFEL